MDRLKGILGNRFVSSDGHTSFYIYIYILKCCLLNRPLNQAGG